MDKVDFINITNKIQQSTKSQVTLGQLLDLLNDVKKTNIKFGSYSFKSEDQELIPDIVLNENVINAILHGLEIGSFDYIYEYSNTDKHLIFSRPCADRAYAIYMFMTQGYRMDVSKLIPVNSMLQVKTFNELSYNVKRMFYAHKITCHEYDVFEGSLTADEIGWLRKYLDEC